MKIVKTFVLFGSCMLCGLFAYAQEKALSGEEVEAKLQTSYTTMLELAKSKNYMQAIKQCEEILGLISFAPEEYSEQQKNYLRANMYYNMSCYYSLDKNKNKAFDYLTKAIDSGYKDYQNMKHDKDFDNIRNDKRFAPLLERIRKTGDYVYILQQAPGYQKADTTGLPRFTYDPATVSNMKRVRSAFKIDSVAGQGDEVSKLLNILSWVHNNVRHDGSHWPVCEHDAIDLYNYAKANNRGINCRMLAIVLNECYLSMGFASRYVTCLPEDSTDMDCHVINCVYSKTLNKWLWMDPTFNAYLKDENGNLLSIEEVRERIITNKPVVLNADANWNNENPRTKEQYIDGYMAKNLYWIQCPANSCFNPESPYRNMNNIYISLTPKGFEGFGKNGRTNYITTSNPVYFWQAPEK